MLCPVALLLQIGVLAAAPVLYDQRQEGEVNVHAQFEDVVILFVPKTGDALSTVVNFFAKRHEPDYSFQDQEYPPTPPQEFESPDGDKSPAVQAALEAAKPEIEEVEEHSTTTTQATPTQPNTTQQTPTTDGAAQLSR